MWRRGEQGGPGPVRAPRGEVKRVLLDLQQVYLPPGLSEKIMSHRHLNSACFHSHHGLKGACKNAFNLCVYILMYVG